MIDNVCFVGGDIFDVVTQGYPSREEREALSLSSANLISMPGTLQIRPEYHAQWLYLSIFPGSSVG